MDERKHFGTDGIRGRVGEEPITAEFCLRLGWAVGKTLANGRSRLALIGKDTRLSGYMLESVLEAGFVSAGVNVGLLTPIPTPAVAYLTRAFRADVGVVISASHNAYDYNGVKFFDAEGAKLRDEQERAIEAQLAKGMKTVPSNKLGKVQRLDDARGRYIEFCKGTVERRFRLRGLKIVVDCAHGAAYRVAPGVFSELGAEVSVIGAEPDGMNINAGCGSTCPETMAEEVVAQGADLGIALDGDGDRVIMADENGAIVDGDELLYVIASHGARTGRLNGGVVGTSMSNAGLERALKAIDVPFSRADMGDRHVLEAMRARNWSLGGEPSGHIVCSRLTTTGDGIVAALQVLVALVETGKPLAELRTAFARSPQSIVNVEAVNPQQAIRCGAVAKAQSDVEAKLNGRGRVLLRPSGTEPVVRVMVEGEDPDQIAGHAKALAEAVRASAQG